MVVLEVVCPHPLLLLSDGDDATPSTVSKTSLNSSVVDGSQGCLFAPYLHRVNRHRSGTRSRLRTVCEFPGRLPTPYLCVLYSWSSVKASARSRTHGAEMSRSYCSFATPGTCRVLVSFRYTSSWVREIALNTYQVRRFTPLSGSAVLLHNNYYFPFGVPFPNIPKRFRNFAQ